MAPLTNRVVTAALTKDTLLMRLFPESLTKSADVEEERATPAGALKPAFVPPASTAPAVVLPARVLTARVLAVYIRIQLLKVSAMYTTPDPTVREAGKLNCAEVAVALSL